VKGSIVFQIVEERELLLFAEETVISLLVCVCTLSPSAFATFSSRIFELSISEAADFLLRTPPLSSARAASSVMPPLVEEIYDELLMPKDALVLRTGCHFDGDIS
jgi:hypothetical protein